jgi:hypothetical protein
MEARRVYVRAALEACGILDSDSQRTAPATYVNDLFSRYAGAKAKGTDI